MRFYLKVSWKCLMKTIHIFQKKFFTSINLILFKYLLIWKVDLQKQEPEDIESMNMLLSAVLLLKRPQSQGLGLAEARDQELHLGLPQRWQKLKYLGHFPLHFVITLTASWISKRVTRTQNCSWTSAQMAFQCFPNQGNCSNHKWEAMEQPQHGITGGR